MPYFLVPNFVFSKKHVGFYFESLFLGSPDPPPLGDPRLWLWVGECQPDIPPGGLKRSLLLVFCMSILVSLLNNGPLTCFRLSLIFLCEIMVCFFLFRSDTHVRQPSFYFAPELSFFGRLACSFIKTFRFSKYTWKSRTTLFAHVLCSHLNRQKVFLAIWILISITITSKMQSNFHFWVNYRYLGFVNERYTHSYVIFYTFRCSHCPVHWKLLRPSARRRAGGESLPECQDVGEEMKESASNLKFNTFDSGGHLLAL